jgi:hypothetical protein
MGLAAHDVAELGQIPDVVGESSGIESGECGVASGQRGDGLVELLAGP